MERAPGVSDATQTQPGVDQSLHQTLDPIMIAHIERNLVVGIGESGLKGICVYGTRLLSLKWILHSEGAANIRTSGLQTSYTNRQGNFISSSLRHQLSTIEDAQHVY